jgi:UMF1 family MFS transporter
MWVLQPDGTGLYLALATFCVAFIAAEFALIFTNALLPSLGPSDKIGKISGAGLAIGYAGGVASLVIMLLFFAEGDTGKTFIGLDPVLGLDASTREGTRSVGPFTALWFALFMIPFFLWVREDTSQHQKTSVSTALSELRTSFRSILKRRSLTCYLSSSMFYRDALNGLYSFGGIYAALVLDWSITMIGVFGITAALAATFFTYIGGVCDGKFGPKPVIIFCIFALVSVCISLVAMSREMFFGVPLAQGSAIPNIVMYICGAVIGGAGGALQGASRSLMVRHADPVRPTEAFGFYALSGKATAFLAPALIGITTTITNSARFGIAPVVGLFLLGLILLTWVNPKGEVYETSA